MAPRVTIYHNPACGTSRNTLALIRVLVASMMAMAGYWLSGLWTASVTHYYLASLPGVIIATPLGRLVTARTDTRVFLRYVNLGLLLIAAALLAEAL